MLELFPNGAAHYLIGGLLIGCGVAFLFATTGLVGGASTLFSSTWSFVSQHAYFQSQRFVESRSWRLVYAAGMLLGTLLVTAFAGGGPATAVAWPLLLIGGVVAGFGARLANGCTSGHGICGLASLQLPSLLAVMTFLATAFATANVVRALGGQP
ncbi:MAG TPA: YeeE/YedE thiosulfate transporter family protein [Planctomycetota bacterium]